MSENRGATCRVAALLNTIQHGPVRREVARIADGTHPDFTATIDILAVLNDYAEAAGMGRISPYTESNHRNRLNPATVRGCACPTNAKD